MSTLLWRHISTDPKEPLVPPRFLERFSNRKVKQGTSITLSVKVEGVWCVQFGVVKNIPSWVHLGYCMLLMVKNFSTQLDVSRVSDSYGVLVKGGISRRCPVDQSRHQRIQDSRLRVPPQPHLDGCGHRIHWCLHLYRHKQGRTVHLHRPPGGWWQ